jgi:1-acyl-sn-glycerol-3-phosphate acyltransferase
VRLGYRLSWWITNLVARVLLGLRVEGREHIPGTGGLVVACNHISYWDPPVLGMGFNRELFYLAKRDLFRNRWFAALIKAHNAVPLSRDAFSRSGLVKAIEIVNSGEAIVIFPEGGRGDPKVLREPKAGLGMVVDKTSCPVLPAYVVGSDTIRKCLMRRRSLKVYFGAPIRPEEFEAKGGEGKERYVRISQIAMDRMALLKARAESAG